MIITPATIRTAPRMTLGVTFSNSLSGPAIDKEGRPLVEKHHGQDERKQRARPTKRPRTRDPKASETDVVQAP
jgi:hypothetical protein